MENFKVEHFKSNNPEGRFPQYRSLLPSESWLIRSKLASMLGLEQSVKPKTIVATINDNAMQLRGMNAGDSGFSLIEAIDHLSIKPKDNVYLNWYQYDEIDEMTITDLDRYFEYIWYPGSDDMDIFDSTLHWILSISHDGYIRFTKIQK